MLLLLCFLATVGGRSAWAQSVSVRATLTRDTVAVGELVQFQIQCNGTSEVTQPPPIAVDGLSIQYLGPFSQTQIINFNVTRSVAHTYQVQPQRAGEFTIPAIEVELGGQRFRTAPLKLKVVAGNPGNQANPGNQGAGATPLDKIAFAEIVLPKKTAYVGEALPSEIRLYVDARVPRQLESMPQFEGEGFTKTKLQEPRQEVVRKDEREYVVYAFRTAITPSKAGRITIGPAEFNFIAQIPRAQRNRQRSIFDMFEEMTGGGTFAANQRMTSKAEAVELEVKPLPVQGRPADFSGAVGEFQFAAEGSPREVKVGDPVTMRMRVSGHGNFDRVTAPAMTDATGWRSYPASGSFAPEDDIATSGTKTFEMAVIPETAQTALPEFQFSYFDPTAEKYVTRKSAPTPLLVTGAAPPPPPPVPQSANNSPETPPDVKPPAPKATDILGQHYELGAVQESFEPLWKRRSFLLAQAVPLLLLVGLIGWRLLRRSETDRERSALLREKNEALRRLRGETSHAEFFDAAARVIQLETALANGHAPGSVDASAACRTRKLEAETEEAVAEIFNARAELLYAGNGGGDGRISTSERDRVLATIEKFSSANGKG